MAKKIELSASLVDKLSKVPPKLLEMFLEDDYSNLSTGSPEFAWMSFQKGKKNILAQLIWRNYREKKTLEVSEKLWEILKNKDYTGFTRSALYEWVLVHKEDGDGEHFTIADVVWAGLLDWRIDEDMPEELKRIFETKDYEKLLTDNECYKWLTIHKLGGKCKHYKIADVIWEEYQAWRECLRPFLY